MITALTIWAKIVIDFFDDIIIPPLVKAVIGITVWFAIATDIVLITLGVALIRLLWSLWKNTGHDTYLNCLYISICCLFSLCIPTPCTNDTTAWPAASCVCVSAYSSGGGRLIPITSIIHSLHVLCTLDCRTSRYRFRPLLSWTPTPVERPECIYLTKHRIWTTNHKKKKIT